MSTQRHPITQAASQSTCVAGFIGGGKLTPAVDLLSKRLPSRAMTTALRDAALALGVTPLPARISIANTHAPRPWAPFAAGWATAPVLYLGGGTTPDLAAIAYPADDPIHFEVCR